jgi:uncharacterized damage-inducible protein DinB
MSGALVACAACTDPKAVQTFAGMAPDPSIAQGLTHIYVAEPEWRARLNQGTNVAPDPKAQAQTADRTAQAKAIVSIDTGIREYMKALGALADKLALGFLCPNIVVVLHEPGLCEPWT